MSPQAQTIETRPKLHTWYPNMRFNPMSPITSAAFRFIFYAFFMGAMVLLVTWEAQHHHGPHLFSEKSILESLQVTLLFLTVAAAYLAGLFNKAEAPLASLLVGAAGIAAIREFDFALDRFVFDGAWQALALAVAVLTGVRAFQRRAALKQAITAFLGRPSFGIMAAGFITVFVFSRLFGRQVLWAAVMQEGYLRVVKNAVEESCELLGYGLIFFGALEFLHEALQNRQTAPQGEPETKMHAFTRPPIPRPR